MSKNTCKFTKKCYNKKHFEGEVYMEEINLKELLDYYKSKILYIAIIIFVTLAIGLVYKVGIEHPKYESKTTLILAGFNLNNEEQSIDNNELTINQKLVTTYQEIIKSEKVLSQVIKELRLDYEISTLASHVSVSSVTDTEVIRITVSDEDPKKAYKIVSKIAEVFSDEVKDIYNVSNVSVLDAARVPKVKSNMSILKSSVLFIAIGLVVAFGIITVIYYFDTSIKTVEQLEDKFDVPVLGAIPNYNTTRSAKKSRKVRK
ncbi:MAG: hypothetical protein E7158_03460 [Firmicutes bacterium]|nr:hypothetical protein [Bacillota bacterium]